MWTIPGTIPGNCTAFLLYVSCPNITHGATRVFSKLFGCRYRGIYRPLIHTFRRQRFLPINPATDSIAPAGTQQPDMFSPQLNEIMLWAGLFIVLLAVAGEETAGKLLLTDCTQGASQSEALSRRFSSFCVRQEGFLLSLGRRCAASMMSRRVGRTRPTG